MHKLLGIIISTAMLGILCENAHAADSDMVVVQPKTFDVSNDSAPIVVDDTPSSVTLAKNTTPVPKTSIPAKTEYSSNNYPEAALRQTYQEEIYKLKDAEDAERRAIKARDQYETKKAQAEHDIEARRYSIQNSMLRAQRAESDMQEMETELKDVQQKQAEVKKNLEEVEMQAQQSSQMMGNTKRTLEADTKTLEKDLKSLQDKQTFLSASINKNQIEAQKMRAAIATLQSQIDDIDASVASLDSEEMKTRTEWLTYKQQVADINSQKGDYLKMLQESKEKYAAALKDLHVAEADYKNAEKSRQQTAAYVQGEVAKIEKEIQLANKNKMIAQGEKIRLDAENEKLSAYVAMMKTSKDYATKEESEADLAVMQSRLGLEKSRTELTQEVAYRESKDSHQRKQEAMMRGLASAEEASNIIDGGKTWTSSKLCKLYKQPSTGAEEAGTAKPGQQLTGKEESGGWVKVLNGSEALYVDKSCGRFSAK